MLYKSILKVVGVVAVAVALCVGCGGDNGVSGGGDSALYGTWNISDTYTYTFNRNGTYEIRYNMHNFVFKGTYSADGTTLTLNNLTEVCSSINDRWGCRNRKQYKDALIEAYTSEPSMSIENIGTLVDITFSTLGGTTYSYSVDGNTLKLCVGSSCAGYNKQ